jgi:hypothetical protein
MDAGEWFSVLGLSLAPDAIRDFRRGCQIAFVGPVDERKRKHDDFALASVLMLRRRRAASMR